MNEQIMIILESFRGHQTSNMEKGFVRWTKGTEGTECDHPAPTHPHMYPVREGLTECGDMVERDPCHDPTWTRTPSLRPP